MTSMPAYGRTAAQRKYDFEHAREWEEFVAKTMGPAVITRFDSIDDLDIWVPGFYVELKEKNQKYSSRWFHLPGVPEQDLFIIDELTVRRSLKHAPHVVFLLKDTILNRLFFAPIWELISVERFRVNRTKKGKWVIDMTNFLEIESETQVHDLMLEHLANTAWLQPQCLTEKEVPQA